MNNFVLLFRGINVGGNNLLPMKPFVETLKQQGYQDVKSYIQSGNIVLNAAHSPQKEVQDLVTQYYGFTPALFVLDDEAFTKAASANPFTEYEGKFVHLYFCQNPIELNQQILQKYIAPTEQYFVVGKVFYLHAPDGIGRSKLVANIEACLGQSGTGRNLNTINKIGLILKGMIKG